MTTQTQTRHMRISSAIPTYVPVPTTGLSTGNAVPIGKYTPGNFLLSPNSPTWKPGDIVQALLGAATLILGIVALVLKYRKQIKTFAGQCNVIIHTTLRNLQVKVIYRAERVQRWFGF
ncbi:hypothetical protein BDD12DRAFT_850584 [Trichophaea hybrida]|nr:hypothetical protein BDD12DRAFT_850584 [Trichophaea hybrida]